MQNIAAYISIITREAPLHDMARDGEYWTGDIVTALRIGDHEWEGHGNTCDRKRSNRKV